MRVSIPRLPQGQNKLSSGLLVTELKKAAFQKSVFTLLMIVFILGASLYTALAPENRLLNWYSTDDGFYYYVVAQNIVQGKGITFDGVNPTNGFHPLWMLVCLPVFAIFQADRMLPLRAIVLIFGILQAGSLVLLFRLLARRLTLFLSAACVLLLGINSFLSSAIFSGGLESALVFFMVVLLLWMGERFRENRQDIRLLLLTGIAAGLAVLSRLDLVFTAAFYGLWLIFDRTEDAVQLLVDIAAACVIVTTAAVIRLGFDLVEFNRTILAGIIIWAALGSAANWLNGFFTLRPKHPLKNMAGRILAHHALLTLLAALTLWGLAGIGLLNSWSRAMMLYSSAGWLAYTLLKAVILHFLKKRTSHNTGQVEITPRMVGAWIKKPLAYFLPLLLALGGYMLWSQLNYGTPMPVSGQIKTWWGTLGNTVYGAPINSFNELSAFLFGGSPFSFLYDALSPIISPLHLSAVQAGRACWLLLIIALIVVTLLNKNSKKMTWLTCLPIFPLFTGILLRLIYFYVTGYVHFRKWYWGTETLLIFLLFAAVLGSLWEIRGRRAWLRIVSGVSVCVLLVFLGMRYIQNTWITYSHVNDSLTPHEYIAVTQAIELETEPGSVIGIPGGGAVSYFIHDRTIINLDGLINSKAYFDLLKQADTHAFMRKMNMRYVYAHQYVVTGSLPLSAVFEGHLASVVMINGKYLYRYQ